MEKNKFLINKTFVITAIFAVVVFSMSLIISGCRVIPISVDEVYKIIINHEDYIIVDVRTPEEYGEGHIEGAKLIPISELEKRLDELPKDKPIIVYCRSGNRSKKAANVLVKNSFRRVYDMGGIVHWQEKGYPIVKS